MRKYIVSYLCIFVALFFLSGVNNCLAQEKLLSVEFPNGTNDLSDEVTDPVSGYKLIYYNMKYLQDVGGKTYYQFNSNMGSYVKIEAPSGEYFQVGDKINIDTYVNRGSSDSRDISIYNQENYAEGVLLGTVNVPGSVAGMYNITLANDLPENTSVLFFPATSVINSYINIHAVEVYGERGKKAKLASLTLGGTAHLDGYKVNYVAEATSAENTVSVSYTKETDKEVILSVSDVQTMEVRSPDELTNWHPMPASLTIPETPGGTYYYYVSSSLADHETVYYELTVTRRNTTDVVYNYDLRVNPITSLEDPDLDNIVSNAGGFHSVHGWRFNYVSSPDETIQLKVEGDAIIKLGGSVYNSETSKITASVNNPGTGSIVPNDDVTAAKGGYYNNFYYSGGENVITFTYSGVAASFLSYITILNEGSGEADLRAIFVGETELALSDFDKNEYTLKNKGFISDPTANHSFPDLTFAMKKNVTAPSVTGSLNTNERVYTYTFEFAGIVYKIHIPYESETGYAENVTEQRYDISTPFGLKTVVAMINEGTAAYKTIYLPNGTYDLGDVDGAYLHGISLTAPNVVLVGESHQARVTGKYYGVTSSVVEIKGANTVVRNLTIESLVGDNGVGPALSTGADNILFDKVQIIGWQDTYVGGGGRHLFNECIVAGSVDFICNGGENTVDYFLACELQIQYRKNGGYITAPQGQSYFNGCRVTNVPSNVATSNGNFTLARPWRETGKAFFLNTTFDIVPNFGFVTMSGNVFPKGSCGSVGNLKEADKSILSFSNDLNTPVYEMTEADILRYSSIYTMCGEQLSALVAEQVVVPACRYTTLCAADALVVPAGIKAYAIAGITEEYAELGALFSEGDPLPAGIPVVLEAEVSKETTFLFAYADNSSLSPIAETNLLSGSLIHRVFEDNTSAYATLGQDNGSIGFAKQGNTLPIMAQTAYLVLEPAAKEYLPLKGGVLSSIETIVTDTDSNENDALYDLQGRRLMKPEKGQIYLSNGSKRIRLK